MRRASYFPRDGDDSPDRETRGGEGGRKRRLIDGESKYGGRRGGEEDDGGAGGGGGEARDVTRPLGLRKREEE